MIQQCSFLVLGLCLMPAAFSAPQVPADFPKHYILLPPGVSGTFGRTVIGDLNADQLPDGVVMVDATPVLVVAPGALSSTVLPFDSVTDIAVLPRTSPQSGDVFVSVDAVGLKRWNYNQNPDLRYAFDPELLDGVDWAGATRVRSADLDGGGAADLIGVRSDGRTVVGMIGGSGGSFTPCLGFLAPATVRDLGTLQWDGDAESEIWLHTNINVEIYDQTGERIHFARTLATGDAAVALKRPELTDGLAVVTKASATSQNQLLVVFGAGVGHELPVPQLGTMGVVGLAAADLDGDGDEDLVISQTGDHCLKRVTDRYSATNLETFATLPGTQALDPTYVSDVFTGNPGGQDPTNHATPGWADLDGDGVPDLLFPKQSLSVFLSLPGWEVPVPDLLPPNQYEFFPGESGHPVFRSMYYDSDCEGADGRLILQLDNGWGVPVTQDTKLEMIIWRMSFTADFPETTAIRHYLYDLEDYPDQVLPPYSPGDGDFLIPALLPQNGHAFQTIYYLLVRVLANGVTPLRSYFCGVTGDFYGQGSCQYLVDLPGAWPASIPWDFEACSMGLDKAQRGGAIPLPRIPEFEPGQAPIVPPPINGPAPVQ